MINNPSVRGVGCEVGYDQIFNPSCMGWGYGNMPDFNLGVLKNSPCDSLVIKNSDRLDIMSGLHVYPNPSSGEFTVSLPYARGTLEIMDITGRVYKVLQVKDKELKIELDIKTGIYNLNFKNSNYKVNLNKKLIIVN